MAAQLHYLTVQDILWINSQITGKVNTFNFAKLEEATYYQYAYGDSNHLVSQAARFLPGFLKMNSLEAGNHATAFVGVLTFLKINGMAIDLKDSQAQAWFEGSKDKQSLANEGIKSIAKPIVGHHAETPDVKKVVRDLLTEFQGTIANL